MKAEMKKMVKELDKVKIGMLRKKNNLGKE